MIEEEKPMVHEDPEGEEEDNGAHQFIDGYCPEKNEAEQEARLVHRWC